MQGSPIADDGGNAVGTIPKVTEFQQGVPMLGPSLEANSGETVVFTGLNGEQCVRGCSTELITLSTSAATTDSVGNLLPTNAIIDAVVTRVTTAIATAASFTVGDDTTAARFAASSTGITAGSTQVGLAAMQGGVSTNAAGPVQTTAATVRITCNATPSAGVVRVTVFYRQYVPPTQ